MGFFSLVNFNAINKMNKIVPKQKVKNWFILFFIIKGRVPQFYEESFIRLMRNNFSGMKVWKMFEYK